jgi:hypothetical protein
MKPLHRRYVQESSVSSGHPSTISNGRFVSLVFAHTQPTPTLEEGNVKCLDVTPILFQPILWKCDTNQFFAESQFESYRMLGAYTMEKLCSDCGGDFCCFIGNILERHLEMKAPEWLGKLI